MKCPCLVLKFTYNWILFLTERGTDKGNTKLAFVSAVYDPH